MHEWPLLIFTLLLQGAVGVTLFLSLKLFREGAADDQPKRQLLSVFVICVLAGCGLLASVFHLGYPLNAFNALRHIGSSWLSREIVFASLFLASAGLGLVALFFKSGFWKGLMALALLLGLIDVFCMGKIYMHSSVVTWMHVNTLVMFYGSVIIVGAAITSILLPLRGTSVLRGLAVAVVAAVLMRMMTQIPYMAWLSEAGLNDALTFPHHPLETYHATSGLRLSGWILSVVGACIFSFGAFCGRKGGLLMGVAMLVTAEVLLRFVFFSIG